MDNVWSSLSQQVQVRLGRPLPDHPPDDAADPEFLTLLSQLRQADPDLAEEVISAYTGTSEQLPSEAEAAAERRRQRVHRHLFERFFRPDGLRTGRRRLNLRKMINWIAAATGLLVVVWSLIPKSTHVSIPASRVAPAMSQTMTQPNSHSATPTVPSSPAPSTALSPKLRSTPPTEVQPPAPSLTFSPPRFPLPAPGEFTGPLMPPPPLPSGPGAASTQVIVFEANNSQAASSSPVVYQRKESETNAQGSQVVVYASPDRTAATTQSTPPTPDASARAAAPAVPRGQLLEARLVTPVAVSSSGAATPALAEIVAGPLQGTLLFGQATRSPEGLVLIQFSALASKDGKDQPFRGGAYDAEVGRMGVAGQVSTMMPGAASALQAATMQAVSDYMAARVQQQQATITNGFLTITQGMPSFWDGLAAAVARAFAPSTQATTGPAVVTRLERGQAITVLVI